MGKPIFFWQCLTAVILVFFSGQSVHAAPIPLISSENILQKKQEGSEILLVDIRKPEFFSKCHINGSINVAPHIFLSSQFLKNKEIILVYGGIDHLAAQSLAQKAEGLGFSSVSLLDGGITSWADRGLPLQELPEKRKNLYSLHPAIIHQVNLKQSQDVVFIDLRNKNAFSQNALTGAVNFPFSKENMKKDGKKLAKYITEIKKKNDKQIILISQSPLSSRVVHDFRIKYQLQGLFYLEGGMDGYLKYKEKMKAVLAGKKNFGRAHQAECR